MREAGSQVMIQNSAFFSPIAKNPETMRRMSSPIHEPVLAYDATSAVGKPRTKNALVVNLTIALFVWALWLVFGGRLAIQHLILDWRVALTMVFGSMVGGGTSEGGG